MFSCPWESVHPSLRPQGHHHLLSDDNKDEKSHRPSEFAPLFCPTKALLYTVFVGLPLPNAEHCAHLESSNINIASVPISTAPPRSYQSFGNSKSQSDISPTPISLVLPSQYTLKVAIEPVSLSTHPVRPACPGLLLPLGTVLTAGMVHILFYSTNTASLASK